MLIQLEYLKLKLTVKNSYTHTSFSPYNLFTKIWFNLLI